MPIGCNPLGASPVLRPADASPGRPDPRQNVQSKQTGIQGPIPASSSRRRLLVAHQGLDLADTPQRCLPDLQLKGTAPIPRRHGGAAFRHLGIEITSSLEDVPQLAFQPGPLDEVPALQPGGKSGHRFGLSDRASLAEAPDGASSSTGAWGRADATGAAAEPGKVLDRREQNH